MRHFLFIGHALITLTVMARLSYAAEDATRAQEIYARWQASGTATLEEKNLMEQVLFPLTGRVDRNSLDNVGGPDGFGYRWVDNQHGDTASFEWIELCGDPLSQFGPTGDDQTAQVSWSFPFPFYGQNFSLGYVSINGKITFENGDGAWLNRCLTVDAVQPTINVHWDDLVAQDMEDCGNGAARIKYRDFGNYVVVEWNNVWHFPQPEERFTFEAILLSTGAIKLQYDSLNCWSYCNSATVGIDVPGTNGIEYLCNGIPETNVLAPGRAVWFHALPVAQNPEHLVIAPSGTDIVLCWTPLSGSVSYRVYRSTDSEVPILPANLIAEATDTTYSDVGVTGGAETKFFYAVTGYR
jgi:hypothetical protein